MKFSEKIKRSHVKWWIIGMLIASCADITFVYYCYVMNVPMPNFSLLDLAFIFALGFFPSIVSKVLSNLRTGQIKGINKIGVADSFRESVIGWFIYYALFVTVVVVYDWFSFGKLPDWWFTLIIHGR